MYRNQYFNPFEAIKPSPYVPMFNMDLAMKAGEMAYAREQQGIEMESQLQELFGNIRPTSGRNAQAYVDDLQNQYEAQMQNLASKAGGYADPDNLRAIRKMVTNFRSDPNLRHIVEFEDMKKKDAAIVSQMEREGKAIRTDADVMDAFSYDQSNNLIPVSYRSGVEAKLGEVQDSMDKAIKLFGNNVVSNITQTSGIDVDALNRAITGENAYIGYNEISNKVGKIRKNIIENINAAFNQLLNDPVVQQKKREQMFLALQEGRDIDEAGKKFDEKLRKNFEERAILQEGTAIETATGIDKKIVQDALFGKEDGKTPEKLASNLSESYSTSIASSEPGGIKEVEPYQSVISNKRKATKVVGDELANDIAKTLYNGWKDNVGNDMLSDIMGSTDELSKLIISEDIIKKPTFWDKVSSFFGQLKIANTIDPRTTVVGRTAPDIKSTEEKLKYYQDKLKKGNVDIAKVFEEMISNGDFDEAKSIISGAISQIRTNHQIRTGEGIIIDNEQEMLVKMKPFEETMAKIEETETSLDNFYKNQQNIFTSDLANTTVYEFGIGKDNEGAESEIQRRIKSNLPQSKFELYDQYGSAIDKSKIKNISKIYGITTTGNTTILFGNIGSGDEKDDVTIKIDDEIVLNKLKNIAKSPLLDAAIELRNVSIVEGNYLWNKRTKEKINLPDGYEFKSKVIDGELNLSLLKNGKEISVYVPDHLGGVSSVKYLSPQNSFLFLSEILENNEKFRQKLQ